MATTLTEPVAAPNELAYASFAIEKFEKNENGDIYVFGKASDDSVDTDEQIVDSKWMQKAVQEWLSTGANVRVQHQSQRDPAGVGVEAYTEKDGSTWVKSLVVEPVAKRLVETKTLRAYSVGIARPKIVRDSVARGGRIVDGELCEISLVDRPANKNCGVQIVKSASDGVAEYVDELFGPDDVIKELKDAEGDALDAVITKLQSTVGDVLNKAVATAPETVSVDLPKDVSVSFSPADLAKLLNHRAVAEQRVANGEIAEKRKMDPDVGGGVDRDKIPASDFAGRNRSFPIVTPGDVSDAASSIGRAGADNYSGDELKHRIISIARRKGPSFVAELPDSWKEELGMGKTEGDPELEKKKKPFAGAAKPFGSEDSDGKDSDGDGKDMDDEDKKDDEAKPTTTKGVKDCPKCGKGYHADSKLRRCEGCNGKLPRADKSDGSEVEKGLKSECQMCGKMSSAAHHFCPKCGHSKADAQLKAADAVIEKKKKKNKPVPGEGVVGSAASDIDPVPAHREPDGMAIEAFESDAGLPTDPDSRYLKTAQRHAHVGAPSDLGALHDHLCPAFDPSEVAKCFHSDALAELSVADWQQKALDAAAGAPLEEARAMAHLWQHALTLKNSDPEILAELREELHKEFSDAHKGPGGFPTPSELDPERFRRLYIREGHANPGADYDGPISHAVPNHDIEAPDFDRGPLTAGHAETSPSNKGAGIIEPAPLPQGMGRTYYRNAEREAAKAAMKAMHDHIAQTFPDLCAASGPGLGGEPAAGARPVPLPVGKSEGTPVDEAGDLTVKAAKVEESSTSAFDPEIVKSAVAEANAGLLAKFEAALHEVAQLNAKLASNEKMLRKQQKRLDALADIPDPREAPFKGLALKKETANKSASGVPVAARTVAENAEQTQMALMQVLQTEARTNPDPAQREAAWNRLYQMTGIRP